MNVKDILFDICKSSTPSGRELIGDEPVIKLISKYGAPNKDTLGNIVCEINPAGKGKNMILTAHLDEIALIVTAITDDGFIKVGPIGGVDKRILISHEVQLSTNPSVIGVISSLPPHLTADADREKMPDITDIAIDVGLTKEKAEKIIHVGDIFSFRGEPVELLNGCIASKGIDDKAGVASIIKALEILSDKEYDARITVVFATQEEIGGRGAKCAAYVAKADEAIAIDVSFAKTPGCPDYKCGEMGCGPMIGIAPILNKEMTDTCIKLAKDNNIKYQLEIMNGETGTDADSIFSEVGGIKTALLSVPLKYMHTSCEVVDVKDIEATAQLLAEYILQIR